MSASSVRNISRRWTGRLAHYRGHANAEHLEALLAEAIRFVGLHLENDLSRSDHWADAPLSRRATLLLYLVDRGVVHRTTRAGRLAFEARPDATHWVLAQPSFVPFLVPTLEFVAALQAEQARRPRPPEPR